jgi:hypothetical protein
LLAKFVESKIIKTFNANIFDVKELVPPRKVIAFIHYGARSAKAVIATIVAPSLMNLLEDTHWLWNRQPAYYLNYLEKTKMRRVSFYADARGRFAQNK